MDRTSKSNGLGISNHAAERYIERVRPLPSLAAAKRELGALLDEERLTDRCPTWAAQMIAWPGTLFLPISDGIVAVVSNRVVITIVVRHGFSPEARRRRNERKALRRLARQTRAKNRHGRGRPAVGQSW